MLRRVLKSRILWLVVGLLIGAILLPMIPKGTMGVILKFLWGQKWGLLIGVGISAIIGFITRGFGGFRFRIVRDGRGYDEYEEDDEV